MSKKIFVTKPYLPSLEEFSPYLEDIWQSGVLSNNGKYHQELEQRLCDYLGVEHLSLFANGTLALVTLLQVLRLSGEVITTPYSFVATSHSLLWNGLTPVFADVDPETCNIDPNNIEELITPNTKAILAVHCYGRPCDVERIQSIADVYGLDVIYDSAHAFGVELDGESILKHGDASILSFHATKVFNTFEGGAIVCKDLKTKQRIDYLKNFGFVDETTVMAPGINGKMSEFSAALGVAQLTHFSRVLDERAKVAECYRSALGQIKGIRVSIPESNYTENYSYFPIWVEPQFSISRDDLYNKFKQHDIYVRRYFYPLISEFPMYRGFPTASSGRLSCAKKLSEEVICLPIYPGLSKEDQERVISIIQSC